MINEQFVAIDVFRNVNNHILIFDKYFPIGKPQNQYFDIHLCFFVCLDSLCSRKLFKIADDKQKEIACNIYMRWKWMGDKESVIRNAKREFPLVMENLDISESRETKISYEEIRYIQSISDLKYFGHTHEAKLRNERIREIVDKRRISSLVHFSRIENLRSILEYGLKSRKDLEEHLLGTNVIFNDELRLDAFKDAICLSIEFPNYKMLTSYRSKKSSKWVVLTLVPNILWEKDCAFCYSNAASRSMRSIPLIEKKTAKSFESLFEGDENINRTDLHIPEFFPTNPQAEVLVFSPIPITYIKTVYFYNDFEYNEWIQQNNDINAFSFSINPAYFSARKDYKFWKKNETYDIIAQFFDEDLQF